MQSKPLLTSLVAVALLGFGAAAQAQYSAVVRVAPPPPRTEVIPASRPGWVWAPGHYEWRGGEYAWMEGHWMRDRSGYEFREPRWVQRADGSWYMVGGNWEHRMAERAERERRWEDRQAARRGGRDWDGDGVPDRFDRFPRNPNRS